MHHKQSNSCIVYLIILPSFANYSILTLLDNVKLPKSSFSCLYISESKNTSEIVFTVCRDTNLENVIVYKASHIHL